VSAPLAEQQYDWHLPAGFPTPIVPADNPMSAEKVELGRYLFYDARLSANGTQSCGSCHRRERAFTDGLNQAVGSTGENHRRATPSLANVAYASALTWANPNMHRLEEQMLTPMYGKGPIELGLDRSDDWLVMFQRDSTYIDMFKAAFPDATAPITRDNLVKAIATFERSIISARSPYDRYRFEGDATALSDDAKRGEALFNSAKLGCSSCHGGFNFSGAVIANGSPKAETSFASVPRLVTKPARDAGVYDVTKNPADVGKFKVPTLRNITMTAPYMHDGSVARLEDAAVHNVAGRKLTLTGGERRDLLALLESLTDKAMILDMQYENPWRKLIPSRAASW
jgi:cytochrome c peroxidase